MPTQTRSDSAHEYPRSSSRGRIKQIARRGGCRILQPLTHELATTTQTWRQQLAPVIEQVVRTLVPDGRHGRGAATTLTESRRRANAGGSPQSPRTPLQPKRRCPECGHRLTGSRGCPECNDRYVRDPDHPRLRRLADLRESGDDPAHGGSAANKRGAKTSTELRKSLAWDRSNQRPDPAVFTETILPLLDDATAADMARVTGLSAGYCSMIKRGLKIPHPRHWDALTELG